MTMFWRTLAFSLLWALAAIIGYFCEVIALVTARSRVDGDRTRLDNSTLTH